MVESSTHSSSSSQAKWPQAEAQALAAEENDCTLLVTLGSGDVLNLHPVDKYAVACRAVELEIARLQAKKIPAGAGKKHDRRS